MYFNNRRNSNYFKGNIMMIGFNKPYISGKEFQYIKEAIDLEKLSGNGRFTKKCHEYFEKKYGFKKTFLTHSCTGALEMAALLLDVKQGDEIILPSYTFVSTANAFLLRGATLIFADSNGNNPNVDVNHIRQLITPKTKAIVVVHYAGVACDMDAIMQLASVHNIFVVEDAAHAIDSYYKSRPLGSIGHLAAFSFHETKNIISGEGGMLVVNDDRFIDRAEIIWEKGTNRASFFRGEVDKYRWIDRGSSFLPSELTAAFLFAQLEKLDQIQEKRKAIWEHYYSYFSSKAHPGLSLPYIDNYATNNAHLFYVVAGTMQQRDNLLADLKSNGVQAIFHYIPLHQSPFFKADNLNDIQLPRAEKYGDCLIRLPFFVEMTIQQIQYVEECVSNFCG
jgi:dTDP-4-amino-4,6-dideoxygalactose transaminase